jgi:hypothetical protein
MQVYFNRSSPDLAYSASRSAIGHADTLYSAVEHAANEIAELLYFVLGPIFWLTIIAALVATFGVR